MAAIGHDLRLQSLADLLPHSFTTLYELTQFDDDQLNAAIKAGAIHPGVHRTEVQALRKPTRTPAEIPVGMSEAAAGGRYELVVPNNLTADRCGRIGHLLQRLHKKFGVEIIAIKDAEPR